MKKFLGVLFGVALVAYLALARALAHGADVEQLPDLFEEGQGVVAEGQFDANGQLVAKRVLARHDENYMPKEVYDALRDKAAGVEGYDAGSAGG